VDSCILPPNSGEVFRAHKCEVSVSPGDRRKDSGNVELLVDGDVIPPSSPPKTDTRCANRTNSDKHTNIGKSHDMAIGFSSTSDKKSRRGVEQHDSEEGFDSIN
jgi:hypothetical protein